MRACERCHGSRERRGGDDLPSVPLEGISYGRLEGAVRHWTVRAMREGDANGATLDVNSAPGVGSTVTVLDSRPKYESESSMNDNRTIDPAQMRAVAQLQRWRDFSAHLVFPAVNSLQKS